MTNSIDRREKLSYEQFAKEYLYANKPVIITDALREWKARRRWTPEFFKKEFGSMKFTLDDNSKGKTGYKSQGNGAVE
jgi:histone arginine demethylase JMJD6